MVAPTDNHRIIYRPDGYQRYHTYLLTQQVSQTAERFMNKGMIYKGMIYFILIYLCILLFTIYKWEQLSMCEVWILNQVHDIFVYSHILWGKDWVGSDRRTDRRRTDNCNRQSAGTAITFLASRTNVREVIRLFLSHYHRSDICVLDYFWWAALALIVLLRCQELLLVQAVLLIMRTHNKSNNLALVPCSFTIDELLIIT